MKDEDPSSDERPVSHSLLFSTVPRIYVFVFRLRESLWDSEQGYTDRQGGLAEATKYSNDKHERSEEGLVFVKQTWSFRYKHKNSLSFMTKVSALQFASFTDIKQDQ